VEKTVTEHRDRVPATDVSRVESAIATVREAITGDSLDRIRRATDDLQKASHALAEQLYKAQGAGSTAQADTTNDIKEGEVVDA
jgi:molecular chaperone DnaK